MSMTREEAIINLEKLIALYYTASEQSKMVDYSKIIETLELALSALRTPTREQVEKVWRGEWIKERRQTYIPVEYDEQGEVILHDFVVYRCSICGRENTKEEPFCNCGAPMTDAAVLTVMDRLEVLKDGSTTD